MAINLDTAKREISEMVELEEWLLLEIFGYELVDEVKRLKENCTEYEEMGEILTDVDKSAREIVKMREAIQEYIKDGTDRICEITKLREALEFYAKHENHNDYSVTDDVGVIARAALA
jgi:hypothetical protein